MGCRFSLCAVPSAFRAQGFGTLSLISGLFLLLFLSALYFLLPGSSEPAVTSTITALASVDIVLEGQQELVGVAVAEDGTIYFSDRMAGTVRSFSPSGQMGILVDGLNRPAGLALDGQGRLLIAEEMAGRILRVEADQSLTVLATGIKTPRWIAVASDGSLYVSAHRLTRPDGSDTTEGREILRLVPGVSLNVVATGIRRLESLALVNGSLIAATKGLESGAESAGMLLRYSVLLDGSLGQPTTWLETGLKQPVGLALDQLAALFVSTKELDLSTDKSKRAIAKVFSNGTLTSFASGLEDPQGVTFGPDGSLYLSDGKFGRLLRFRAPPPPAVIFPSFTNQSPLTIQGTTEPQSRIDIFNDSSTTLFTSDGAFAFSLNLVPNTENQLTVFSTSQNGQGLTSLSAEVTIIHDNILPVVTNLRPLSGSFLNTATPLIQAGFFDSGSGIDVGKVKIDGTDVTSQAQVAESGFTLNPVIPLTEGSRTVSVSIFDRAGNSAFASTTFTVDVTPPETQIVSGPEGTTSATSVTFTVGGSDNLTPSGSLEFAWRLDGGPFSAFSSQTQISFSALTPGPHTFEVKARDFAGNEDPTPAQRSFTISTLQVLITEPSDGATVPAGNLLVRGTVEAGGAEAGVTVNGFPAAVQGNTFVALVSVTPDMTSLIATATTAAGATATQTIGITVIDSPASPVALDASPVSGISPLTVNFSLSSEVAVTQVDLDANGDGVVDFSGTQLDQLPFTFTQAGVYVATATATDSQGNQFAATAVVQVFDQAALDATLQAKWADFKAALARNDIEVALLAIANGEKEKYRQAFERLAPDLPAIAATLRDLIPSLFQDSIMEYATTQDRDGETFVHFVYFMRDEDGVWKIVAM